MTLITYQDALDHLKAYTGGASFSRSLQDMKQAVRSALSTLYKERAWTYYRSVYGFTTVASQTTGSLTYTHGGGRTVTLSTGTFQSWAAKASILSDSKIADVDLFTTSTAVMDANVNFGAAIAAGTSYEMFQDHFTLPEGFQNVSVILRAVDGTVLRYVTPEEFLYHKTIMQQTGDPCVYTVMQDTELLGQYAVFLYPSPNAVKVYRIQYQRAHRELRTSGDETAATTGTVTIGAVAGSKYVDGNSTTFHLTLHKGAVIRFGTTTEAPTGILGAYPFVEQAVIANVRTTIGTEALQLRSSTAQAFTAVKYVITDPIDIPPDLEDAFLARCRLELVRLRPDTKKQDTSGTEMAYMELVSKAASNDAKDSGPRITGGSGGYFGLSDVPLLAEDAY